MASMTRALLLPALFLLTLGCGSSSGGGNWSCNWNCTSSGASGSHTYPDGPNPSAQCVTDYGSTCSNFSCSCTQN
jgi:phosphoribosyl 1,2-cyclic phosphodiesterase